MRRIRLFLLTLLAFCLYLSAAGIKSGSTACPGSGNVVVSTSADKGTSWTIQAPSTNTGKVYIGGSNVTTSNGVYLNAGDSATALTQSNASPYSLNATWIACTAPADTVTWNLLQ